MVFLLMSRGLALILSCSKYVQELSIQSIVSLMLCDSFAVVILPSRSTRQHGNDHSRCITISDLYVPTAQHILEPNYADIAPLTVSTSTMPWVYLSCLRRRTSEAVSS